MRVMVLMKATDESEKSYLTDPSADRDYGGDGPIQRRAAERRHSAYG